VTFLGWLNDPLNAKKGPPTLKRSRLEWVFCLVDFVVCDDGFQLIDPDRILMGRIALKN